MTDFASGHATNLFSFRASTAGYAIAAPDDDGVYAVPDYGSSGSFGRFHGCVTVAPESLDGVELTLSMEARSPNGSTRVRAYNSNGSPRHFWFYQLMTSSLGEDWERIAVTFAPEERPSGTGDAGTWNRIELSFDNARGCEVRNVMLELGSVAHDWSPSPFDEGVTGEVVALDEVVFGGGDLSSMTGTLPVSSGGTGSTTASGALAALGAAAQGHGHDAADIASGTLDAARLPRATASALGAVRPDGSTVTVDASGALSAVAPAASNGLPSGGADGQVLVKSSDAAYDAGWGTPRSVWWDGFQASLTDEGAVYADDAGEPVIGGALPVCYGGTGADNAEDARASLGLGSSTVYATLSSSYTSGGSITLYRRGTVVFCKFSGVVFGTFSSRVQVATIPAGYRPPTEWYGMNATVPTAYLLAQAGGALQADPGLSGKTIYATMSWPLA